MMALFLLVAPLLLIASLSGYGAALCAILPGPRQSPRFFEAAFTGLFFVTLVVLTANFFTGIGTSPGLYVLALGLALFAVFRRRGGFTLSPLALLAVFTASAVFLVRSSTQLPFDAGLYYLSAMNWTAHQPLPLGLANLEGRLGFDSAWLLFVSALRGGSRLGWAHLVVAEIALRVLVIGWIVQDIQDESANRQNANARLSLIALLLLSVYLLGRFPSPTTTDLPANLMAFCAWLVFCRLMLAQEGGADRRFSFLIMLAMLAITFKLSMAPIALLPILLLARRGPTPSLWRGQPGLLCLTALYGLFWLGRNFVLSGCLAFPVGATCFPVSWGAGRAAGPMAAVIRSWARAPASLQPHGDLFDLAWLPSWLADFAHAPELWLVLVAASLALVLGIYGRRRGRDDSSAGARALARLSLLCSAAGLLLWFLTAPNPRFSWCFFVMLGVTLLFRASVDLGAWTSIRPSVTPRRAVVYAMAILVLTLCIQLTRGAGRIEAPVTASRTVTVPNGWLVFMPAAGDQCWELFPCTPYGLGDTTVAPWHGRLLFRADVGAS